MGLLQRLFSPEYRKALAAEAAGDYLAAARAYALCGELGRVTDMHLAQARLETSNDGRIRALRSALDFAPREDPRHAMVCRLLATALRRRAERRGKQSREGRRDMLEAAELLEEGGNAAAAGDHYCEIGAIDRAIEAYTRVGMLERVEQLLAEQEQRRGRKRRVDDAFRDYELLLQGGQRDEALEALDRAIADARHKGEYRRIRDHLARRLLREGRLRLAWDTERLTVVGRYPVTLGRDVDCDLVVRGPSVSRLHARVLFDAEAGRFRLRDGGSRNGTRLGGLCVAEEIDLPDTAEIALGDSASLVIEARGPELLVLQVTHGRDRGSRAIVSLAPVLLSEVLEDAPPLQVSFSDGKPLVSGAELRLNDALVGSVVQAIIDDRIELAGRQLDVVG